MTALENLKSVYKEHYKDTASIEIYTPVVTQWKDYRYNIFTGKITLDDYVGSVENSPIKFLGHRAKPFVDLGGMRSSSYMIYKKSSKKEDDDENKEPEYVISEIYKKKYSDDLKGGRHSNKKLKDIAEICFNENIKPLLMLIVHAIDKNGFEENPNLTNTLLKSISNAIITNVEGLQTDLITISIKKQKLFPEGKGLGTEFQSALNTLKKESNDINKINNLKSSSFLFSFL